VATAISPGFALDFNSAPLTRLSLLPISVQFLLEITGLAIDVFVLLIEGGAALYYRLLKHVFGNRN